MSEKKEKLNISIIAGEVLDITDLRRVFPDTPSEALTYKLHIETGHNEVKIVEFFTNMFKADGSPNSMYLGIQTIANEVVTRAEAGKGDMVKCVCTLDDNTYYSNGEKVEMTKITGNFCNREEEGKTIKPQQMWKVDALIEEISTKTDGLGEYTEVRALVNKFGKNGFYTNFRIHNKEMIEGFNSLYQVGSIGKLEGTFQQNISKVSSGFGKSVKQKRDSYLEIEGGEEPYTVNDTKHPFHEENIIAMKEKIQTRLDKLKEKDAVKTANTRKISDEEVPF